jgi:hypothetical protein
MNHFISSLFSKKYLPTGLWEFIVDQVVTLVKTKVEPAGFLFSFAGLRLKDGFI